MRPERGLKMAIDHETAERIREMLSHIQKIVLDGAGTERIIKEISNIGFRLVDNLEGVIR